MAFEVTENKENNNNKSVGFEFQNAYIINDTNFNEIINFQNQQFSEELHVNLLAFIGAYMQEKPTDVVDYAIKHFTNIQEKRKKRFMSKHATNNGNFQ